MKVMPIDMGSIFAQWEAIGVYEYLLPILLVFAVVFGILTTTNILGKNKGIHVIIAIIMGLMSVGYASSMGFSFGQFLQELFPRLGVGLSVILCLLVLVGLFVSKDDRRYWLWGLGAIGAIIAIVIITKSFERFTWFSMGSYGDYTGYVIGGVLIVGLIIAVAASGGEGKGSKESPKVAVIGKWDEN